MVHQLQFGSQAWSTNPWNVGWLATRQDVVEVEVEVEVEVGTLVERNAATRENTSVLADEMFCIGGSDCDASARMTVSKLLWRGQGDDSVVE